MNKGPKLVKANLCKASESVSRAPDGRLNHPLSSSELPLSGRVRSITQLSKAYDLVGKPTSLQPVGS